jgi:probable F420-dependent oxidoreductase
MSGPRFGAVFPQTEIGRDAGAVRAYAEAVQELGFDHVLAFDHVTGVDTAVHTDFVERARAGGARSARPYDVDSPFHEVMVLLGFLAGISTLELVTSILVLPQRQTALVAKQVTEVDLLSGGRLRLGVGVGWNPIEYRSLGRPFAGRGDRLEEQIELLRMYWTERSLTFESEQEWAVGVGLAPRPARVIPVWIAGGERQRTLRRVGRLGDGWMPVSTAPRELADALETIREFAAEAGRDPAAIGVQGRIDGCGDADVGRVAELVAGWRELGATHVAFNTMNSGLDSVDGHIAALERALSAVR